MLEQAMEDCMEIAAEAQERAERFEDVSHIMREETDNGAEWERSTHAYENRTGNLEASTIAKVELSGPNVCVALMEMGMHYAEYIVKRRFSAFPGIVDHVRLAIWRRFREL